MYSSHTTTEVATVLSVESRFDFSCLFLGSDEIPSHFFILQQCTNFTAAKHNLHSLIISGSVPLYESSDLLHYVLTCAST
jgi:hypothetical protein